MSLRNTITDLSMKLMSNSHRALIAVTGGRVGWKVGPIQAVELFTIGRKSGERRGTMLTAPVHENGTYILVASKGGDDRNPAWYLNLVDNPDIELLVGGELLTLRARTATPEEKAVLWPKVVAVYGGYTQYQTKTSRDIPVVICEPRP
jgi:deazaflavin-dependent oxidoreductase (nitroreductase family)